MSMVDPKIVAVVAKEVVPIALDTAKELFGEIKDAQAYFQKLIKVSKVKMGEFVEAPIGMFGDKACILLNDDGSKVLLLTSDTIESYQFVQEKKKGVGPSRHRYRYYNITFKNGSTSYVRMRRTYAEAMERYTKV